MKNKIYKPKNKYQNVKEYWRLLKKAANVENKSTISASRFAEYFEAINNPSDHFYQADEDIIYFNEWYINGEYQVMFAELNVEISYLEIKKAVKQLRNGASAGPDLFLNEFFKNGNDTLIVYIYTLFNKIFELGFFPSCWSDGFIVPIYKKGDKNEPSNYRGITLLSTIGHRQIYSDINYTVSSLSVHNLTNILQRSQIADGYLNTCIYC